MTTIDKLTEAANALSTAVQALRDANGDATATASDVIHDLIRDVAALKHRTRRLADTIRLDAVAQVKVEVTGGVAEVTQCTAGVNVTIIDHDNEQNGGGR